MITKISSTKISLAPKRIPMALDLHKNEKLSVVLLDVAPDDVPEISYGDHFCEQSFRYLTPVREGNVGP